MSVRVLKGEKESCLYCSTSMFAFGPIFYEDEDPQGFLDWLGEDPRHLTDSEIEAKVGEWRDRENRKA